MTTAVMELEQLELQLERDLRPVRAVRTRLEDEIVELVAAAQRDGADHIVVATESLFSAAEPRLAVRVRAGEHGRPANVFLAAA